MDNATADGAPIDTTAFYDGLAAGYHLIYGDRWDDAVVRQGRALQRLIAALAPEARDVLDCSCGIGTQAIGLALCGYAVTGTDISEASLARAAAEAERLGARLVGLSHADFRALERFADGADVVVCADNAVPHMLTDADLDAALASMFGALRPGGLLVISTRDYDTALRERPLAAPPFALAGPRPGFVVRTQEWDGPDSPLHTVRFLLLSELDGGPAWTFEEHRVRYRALTAAELSAAAQRAGFGSVAWHSAEVVGFHQPVMTARRPVVASAGAADGYEKR